MLNNLIPVNILQLRDALARGFPVISPYFTGIECQKRDLIVAFKFINVFNG